MEDDNYYEVEHIVDVRQSKEGLEVKIKWLNFNNPDDDTWEPYTNLNDETCLFFLREYRSRLEKKLMENPKDLKKNLESKLRTLKKIIKAWKLNLKENEKKFIDSEDHSVISEPFQKEDPPIEKENIQPPPEPPTNQRISPEDKPKQPIENELENKKTNQPPQETGKSTPRRRPDVSPPQQPTVPPSTSFNHFGYYSTNNGKITPNRFQKGNPHHTEVKKKPIIEEEEDYKIKHKTPQRNQYQSKGPQFNSFHRPSPPPRPAGPQNNHYQKQPPFQNQYQPRPPPPSKPPFNQTNKNDNKSFFKGYQGNNQKNSYLQESASNKKLFSFISKHENVLKRKSVYSDMNGMDLAKLSSTSSTKNYIVSDPHELDLLLAEKDHHKSSISCKIVGWRELMSVNPNKSFKGMYTAFADMQKIVKEYANIIADLQAGIEMR